MIEAEISVRIADGPFEPDAESTEFRLRHRSAGAIASFVGQVRDEGAATTLILEHYPEFCEREIGRIACGAAARWALAGVAIVHRVGRMTAGEPVVFVAAAAPHRRPAFDAVDYLMDYLKSGAPLWKAEIVGNDFRWIEPRAEDFADKARWPAAE
jgi:molybdopterin synthase catalytic subunit